MCNKLLDALASLDFKLWVSNLPFSASASTDLSALFLLFWEGQEDCLYDFWTIFRKKKCPHLYNLSYLRVGYCFMDDGESRLPLKSKSSSAECFAHFSLNTIFLSCLNSKGILLENCVFHLYYTLLIRSTYLPKNWLCKTSLASTGISKEKVEQFKSLSF